MYLHEYLQCGRYPHPQREVDMAWIQLTGAAFENNFALGPVASVAGGHDIAPVPGDQSLKRWLNEGSIFYLGAAQWTAAAGETNLSQHPESAAAMRRGGDVCHSKSRAALQCIDWLVQ